MENILPNMENTEQSLEKTDDNYKVPNLEKGIAVIDVVFRETNRIDPFPSTVERERNIT